MAKRTITAFVDDITGKNLAEKDVCRVSLSFGNEDKVHRFETHRDNVKDFMKQAGENVRVTEKPGRKAGQPETA